MTKKINKRLFKTMYYFDDICQYPVHLCLLYLEVMMQHSPIIVNLNSYYNGPVDKQILTLM